MIFRGQSVADVVEEGADHRLLIGAVAEGPGRRLERMLVAVHFIAHLVAGQPVQHADDLVGQPLNQRFIKPCKKLIFLIGAVGHAGEFDRFVHRPAPLPEWPV